MDVNVHTALVATRETRIIVTGPAACDPVAVDTIEDLLAELATVCTFFVRHTSTAIAIDITSPPVAAGQIGQLIDQLRRDLPCGTRINITDPEATDQ